MIAISAFEDHARVMSDAASTLPATLERVAEHLHGCIEAGNKLLACGNGGSASDAEHLVAELVGRYRDERRALPAINLTGGMASMTAISNDYGFDAVFARHVAALAQPGDVLFAISTSGNSGNAVAAARAAREAGCHVVAFTGQSGGELARHADVVIAAPSPVTARVQELHILCMHIICESLDARLRADEAA